MSTYEINGTYGGSQIPCTIYVYELMGGAKWYAVENSLNLNCTYDDIHEGCDVETLTDCDTATADNPINSENDLMFEVDEA